MMKGLLKIPRAENIYVHKVTQFSLKGSWKNFTFWLGIGKETTRIKGFPDDVKMDVILDARCYEHWNSLHLHPSKLCDCYFCAAHVQGSFLLCLIFPPVHLHLWLLHLLRCVIFSWHVTGVLWGIIPCCVGLLLIRVQKTLQYFCLVRGETCKT